jgi:hypothetical protein
MYTYIQLLCGPVLSSLLSGKSVSTVENENLVPDMRSHRAFNVVQRIAQARVWVVARQQVVVAKRLLFGFGGACTTSSTYARAMLDTQKRCCT